MHAITTRPTRTTAFVKEGMTSEDAMLALGLTVSLKDLDADLWTFSHMNDEMPEGTIAWVSPNMMDGKDVFWILASAGILDCKRSMRQTIVDFAEF